MIIPYWGEILAAFSALTWSTSVIYFRKSGFSIPPLSLNLLMNVSGLLLISVTLAFLGDPFFPQIPMKHYAWMIGGGILGRTLADTLFFASLNKLGASRSAIVSCMYSPIIIFFSYLILGERLSEKAIIGGALILFGILLAARQGKVKEISTRDYAIGTFFGLSALSSMGIGIVAVKPYIETYPLLWGTWIRVLGGTVTLVAFTALLPNRKQLWGILKPQSAWKVALPGCILGGFITMICWVGGFKHADASVSALLNQSSTIWTVLLAALFLKERLTPPKLIAMTLALIGSVLVLL